MKLFQEIKKKFKPSINGLKYASNHKSTRIQYYLAIFIIILSMLLQFDQYEMLYVILSCGLVITAEYFNTAIEEIVDKISPEKSEFGKITKDISASAVFIISIAVAIGYVIILKGKFL